MSRVLTLPQRKRTLGASLAFVLAAAALYAGTVTVPARLVQHPSDSHGSPMLVVTASKALEAQGDNASKRAAARRKASTATAWTSARGA